ncbi:MAG: hypothetical protein K2Z25_15965 [Beijerinckiaceae bacterium]|nr:hypothetical protein [Beijerinckiaceae bacterium]
MTSALNVIASVAKQSRGLREPAGLLRCTRNDGVENSGQNIIFQDTP